MTRDTKDILALSLKHLMREKPLDKITIRELALAAGVNRQTFYYHFRDVYELLGWIYRSEAIAAIADKKSYANWTAGFQAILDYIQTNRTFCLSTYRSLGREHLERFLLAQLLKLLGDVVAEIAAGCPIPAEQQQFITHFYSQAFAGILLEWLEGGLEMPAAALAEYTDITMEGSIVAAMERFAAAKGSH